MNKKITIILGVIVFLTIILVIIGSVNHRLELAYNNGYSNGYAYALEKFGIEE